MLPNSLDRWCKAAEAHVCMCTNSCTTSVTVQPQVVLQLLRVLAHDLVHPLAVAVDAKGGCVLDAGDSLLHRLHLRHGVLVLVILRAVAEHKVVQCRQNRPVPAVGRPPVAVQFPAPAQVQHTSCVAACPGKATHTPLHTFLLRAKNCGNISWHLTHQVVPNSTTAVPGLLSLMKVARSSSLRSPFMVPTSCVGTGTGCGCVRCSSAGSVGHCHAACTPQRCRVEAHTLGTDATFTLVTAAGGWKLCDSQP